MKLLSDENFNAIKADADAASELRQQVAQLQSDNEKLKADFEAVCKTLSDLEASHAKAIEDLNAAHESALKAKSEEVESVASQKAAEIVASQGVQPVAVTPSGPSGGIVEQLDAIKDPLQRAQFIKKHQAELVKQFKN